MTTETAREIRIVVTTENRRTTVSRARRRANRGNSRRSTGPVSEQGKAASRLNGLTHGLGATVPILPGEDPKVYAERRAEWFATYQPVGPDEVDALERAVAASLAIERGRRHEALTLSRRAREAFDHFDTNQTLEAQAFVKRLDTEPVEAAIRLRRTLAGCRYLIERWQALRHELSTRRVWGGSHLTEALALFGYRPVEILAHEPARFLARHTARLCAEGVRPVETGLAPDAVAARRAANAEGCQRAVERYIWPLLGPAGDLPRGYGQAYATLAGELPEAFETSLEALRRFVDDRLAALGRELAALEARHEADRQEAAMEAGLFDPTPLGTLRLRYLTAHERSLRQALSDLERLQSERLAAEAEAVENDTEAASEAAAPSEANEPRGVSEGDSITVVCVDPSTLEASIGNEVADAGEPAGREVPRSEAVRDAA